VLGNTSSSHSTPNLRVLVDEEWSCIHLMVMLSELLHFRVADAHGGTATLADLAISQLDTDYPLVTHLIYRQNGHTEGILGWDTVKSIDHLNRQINVENYKQISDMDTFGQAVRLQQDVLDALILDLHNRRVTRANDLWLDEKDKQLRLSAADTSGRAILRRLTRGWYRGIDRRVLYDWKYIEFLRGDPKAVKAGAGYHSRIIHLPPGEITHLGADE
jgi:hypothetical protein